MIPKNLAEIEWADIQALKDSGREEDDTIEYKSAFSGGSDYLAFSDGQRIKAVDGVAKEVIAFLNGRGGDLIIGVAEADNAHPKIETITPLLHVQSTADRLAQALAAIVEPMQSILTVRAVTPIENADEGIIVIRAPASLRAPHRSMRTKECYIRRGRESVPMPMDEIQDVTIIRSSRSSERLALLASHFSALGDRRIGTVTLVPNRIHLRVVYLPYASTQIILDKQILSSFLADDPDFFRGDRVERNDVAFRNLFANWKPLLRGRRISSLEQDDETQTYVAKELYENGVAVVDFSDNRGINLGQKNQLGWYFPWIVGYLANTMVSLKNYFERYPEVSDGVLRLGYHFGHSAGLVIGARHFERIHDLPEGTGFIPDFEIIGGSNLDDVFQQLQVDICALAGVDCGTPFTLERP